MIACPVKMIGSPVPSASPPKVSVAMVAYKHEKFIAQAVESVMMQQTTFSYELVIGEDCSPDRTREIVLSLQRKYPDRIRVLLCENNVGMMTNFIQTLRACEGDYIALLDGDDYWTDPQKLQKQVKFLEANPRCSACFALTRVVAEGNPSETFYIPSKRTLELAFTTGDLLAKNSVATASVVYRNVMREINFERLNHLKMIDWPLHILVSLRGPVGYIPEEMAVYRLHVGGVWSSADTLPKLQATIHMYDALRTMLPTTCRRTVAAGVVKAHQLISIEHLRNGDRRTSRASALKSLTSIPLAEILAFKWHVKRSVALLLGGCGVPLRWVESALNR